MSAARPGESVRLGEVSARCFARWLEEPESFLLLPAGALEQHGPHLPLGTDAALSGAICEGVAERTGALVAPTLSFGYKSQQRSGGGNHLAGTVSLDAATLIALTCDVVGSFLDQGVRRLAIINGHYENYQFLYEGVDLALRARPGAEAEVILLSYWDYVDDATLAQIYPKGFPGWAVEHGGVLETSLMLHLLPWRVDEAQAPEHPPAHQYRFDLLPVRPERTPSSGCLSAPSGASAEKGRVLYERVVEALAAELPSQFAPARSWKSTASLS